MSEIPIAILAGGLATRLRPISTTIPKGLVEVAGRPFIEHQLELLKGFGFEHVVLCVGHMGEMVEAVIGDGARFGMRVEYVYDGKTLVGTGGALRCALPKLGERFLVLYGDTYLQIDYSSVAGKFLKSEKKGLMTVLKNSNQWDRSNVIFDGESVVCYDKECPREEMEYIDYGLGALRAEVFRDYPEEGLLDLAWVYRDLSKKNELVGYEATSRFYEIGTPASLAETRSFFKERKT